MDNNKLEERMSQLVMVKGVIDGLANNWPCDLQCQECPCEAVCGALNALQVELSRVVL